LRILRAEFKGETMKKLILLLTLTLAMMFAQTKLETRVYDLELAFYNSPIDLNFSEITGYDLDSPFIFLKSIELESFENNDDIGITYKRYLDSGNDSYYQLAEININGNITSSEHINKPLTKDYFTLKSGHPISGIFSFAVTAEFPQEDTGYIEDGFDYCVESGANLMSYPCDSSVALLDAIPSDALSQFEGIIGAGEAATNLNGTWVGSITNLSPGAGYWIKSNTSLCFNYDCSEN